MKGDFAAFLVDWGGGMGHACGGLRSRDGGATALGAIGDGAVCNCQMRGF
jgi:hypothetical protein